MIRLKFFCTLILFALFAATGEAADVPTVMATGEWSKPVADSRGFAVRGRLVLCEKVVSAERREISVFIELQDARDSIGESMQLFCDLGRTDFRPDYKAGLRCELRDKDKLLVKSTPFPFSGSVPLSEWVILPTQATIRLRASPFGIHQPKAMAISPDISNLWVIPDSDANEYFLSGAFMVDPAEGNVPRSEGHIWRGTLDLPTIRFTNQRGKE